MTTRLTPRALGAATTALLAMLALSSCTPQSVAVVPPAAAPPPVASDAALNGEEARFAELLNAERSRAGLAPVTVSTGAVGIARAWAGELARRGTLAHNPNIQGQVGASVSATWARIGENVGMGADADVVHQAFMASAPHRANMLQTYYDIVGIGVVRNGPTLFVSVVFIDL